MARGMNALCATRGRTVGTAAQLLLPAIALIAVVLPVLAEAAKAAPEVVPSVREKKYVLAYSIDYEEERLTARARLTVSNVGRGAVSQVPLLLYRLLTVEDVRNAAGAPLSFTQRVVAFVDEPRRQVNAITVILEKPLAPGAQAELVVRYTGFLAGYVETGTRYVQDRLDPSFSILRLDALAYPVVGLPSERSHRLQGLASFDYEATIEVPESLQVANGGQLVERKVANRRAVFVYRNLRPCWRMDFAIAKYKVLPGDTTTVFSFPEDSANAGQVRDAALRSIRLFSDWFGPTKELPKLSVIEVPNGWGSQRDVTCILQTAAAFQDRSRLYEVYHEVSHMWGVASRDSFPARIEEGLATYLEDVATERLDGVGNRVQHTHAGIVTWLRELLEKQPRYHDLPMRDFGIHGDTDLSYSVGFLMFEVLHALVGDRVFGDIIGGFHERYHATGATTAQFLAHAKERSPVDLTRFFEDWYSTTGWQRFVRDDLSLERIVAEYRTVGDRR